MLGPKTITPISQATRLSLRQMDSAFGYWYMVVKKGKALGRILQKIHRHRPIRRALFRWSQGCRRVESMLKCRKLNVEHEREMETIYVSVSRYLQQKRTIARFRKIFEALRENVWSMKCKRRILTVVLRRCQRQTLGKGFTTWVGLTIQLITACHLAHSIQNISSHAYS